MKTTTEIFPTDKIYLSGKITGTDDYMARFDEAEETLQRRFKVRYVVNPAIVNSMMPNGTTWEDYMRLSKAMLLACDTIYFLPGLVDSRGAKKEFEWAQRYGLNIYMGALTKADKDYLLERY